MLSNIVNVNMYQWLSQSTSSYWWKYGVFNNLWWGNWISNVIIYLLEKYPILKLKINSWQIKDINKGKSKNVFIVLLHQGRLP